MRKWKRSLEACNCHRRRCGWLYGRRRRRPKGCSRHPAGAQSQAGAQALHHRKGPLQRDQPTAAAPEVSAAMSHATARFLTSAVTRFPPEAVEAFFEGPGSAAENRAGEPGLSLLRQSRRHHRRPAVGPCVRVRGAAWCRTGPRALRRVRVRSVTGVAGEKRRLLPRRGGGHRHRRGFLSAAPAPPVTDMPWLEAAGPHHSAAQRQPWCHWVAEGDACAKMQGLSLQQRGADRQVRNGKKKYRLRRSRGSCCSPTLACPGR